jgi:hypothetical protein
MPDKMEVQQDSLKEVLNELFTLLEAQETSSAAVLQLLKDEGIASDEKLATYLDRAGNASNVKWRAARMRMEYLLTPIQKQSSGNDKVKEAKKHTELDKGDDKNKERKQPEARSSEAKASEAKSSEAKPSEAKPSEGKPTDNRYAEDAKTQNPSANEGRPENKKNAASVKGV